ncbi:hypothetical protein ACNKHQ_18850 [Shigella flexneri]
MDQRGYIITNKHVIDGRPDYRRPAGRPGAEALLVGSDSMTDLAVLKINATGGPAGDSGLIPHSPYRTWRRGAGYRQPV